MFIVQPCTRQHTEIDFHQPPPVEEILRAVVYFKNPIDKRTISYYYMVRNRTYRRREYEQEPHG